MDVENKFPYKYIEDDLGEIKAWEQFCGDIYRITTVDPDSLLPDEYYIFRADTHILSDAAKAYGIPLPNHPDPAICASARFGKRQYRDPL